MILPDDLYDYADNRSTRSRMSRSLGENGCRVDHMTIVDDWPDDIPVTEAEVDVFERYFGDVLDRLFGPAAVNPANDGLPKLTPDGNDKS